MNELFIVLFAIIAINSLLVSRLVYKTILTPITFYSVLWCVVGIVTNLGIYGYYLPSELVNWAMAIGSIIFLIIYVLGFKYKSNLINISIQSSTLNIRYVVIINILCFIIIAPYCIKALSVIRGAGFTYLRSIVGNTELGIINNSLISNLLESIIKPIIMTTSVLSVTIMFTNESKKKKILTVLLAVIGVFLYSILNASRILIVNYLFYWIISFLLLDKSSILVLLWREKTKIFIVTIMIAFLLYMQRARSSDISILETFYIYYFSGPAYLTQIVNDTIVFSINNQFLWGTATFGFISNIFSNVLILLTGKPQGSVYLLGSVLTNKQYAVSSRHLVNSMSTVYYNFLLDWGTLGIVLGPIIVAYLSVQISKRAYMERNLLSVSLFVFWINVLIRTIFKWDLLGIDFMVILIALYFFTNQFKNSRISNSK
jgi:oligosaccharide repeat unit polymerase